MFMAHNICVILRVIMYRIRQCKEQDACFKIVGSQFDSWTGATILLRQHVHNAAQQKGEGLSQDQRNRRERLITYLHLVQQFMCQGRGEQIPDSWSPWEIIFFLRWCLTLCGTFLRNLLNIAVLAPRILRWLLDFWKTLCITGLQLSLQNKANTYIGLQWSSTTYISRSFPVL